jgi:hypothetical protein
VPKQTSEYLKLINNGAGRSRRKALTAQEIRDRNEEQAQKNRVRQEARRRALMVLQHRYPDEYASLYSAEQDILQQESKTANKK